MKKQFLTLALLATVAVGGAFAGSANSTATKFFVTQGSPLNEEGECEEPTVIDDELNCSPSELGAQCTINGGTEAYTEDNITGFCTVPLNRPAAN